MTMYCQADFKCGAQVAPGLFFSSCFWWDVLQRWDITILHWDTVPGKLSPVVFNEGFEWVLRLGFRSWVRDLNFCASCCRCLSLRKAHKLPEQQRSIQGQCNCIMQADKKACIWGTVGYLSCCVGSANKLWDLLDTRALLKAGTNILGQGWLKQDQFVSRPRDVLSKESRWCLSSFFPILLSQLSLSYSWSQMLLI